MISLSCMETAPLVMTTPLSRGQPELDGNTVMLVCHQKGRDNKEKQLRNLGMPHPEGYRKAVRAMRQAEKFGFPIICLIDTPAAFPGLDAEERGQGEAIAANLYFMPRLRVPTIAVVIGEGGSGGALAISVADRILMLEYQYLFGRSPRGGGEYHVARHCFCSPGR